MAPITVLMVAEKPSLARSISEICSDGHCTSRGGNLAVHEWQGTFKKMPAIFKMTSVIGHVLSVDFPAEYQSWEKVDPATLFDAPIKKSEANPKARVCRHLQSEARGVDILVLWLDCDREGENICFEVIENTEHWMNSAERLSPPLRQRRIFRAKFSALSPQEIQGAMNTLGEPNRNEALAVDGRAELDLKVGVAFTRFQSRYFQSKYGNLDSSVISYGPCQTPTLTFCVERHQIIQQFTPEPFWMVKPQTIKAGRRLSLEWARGKVFDPEVAVCLQRLVAEGGPLKVTQVSEKEERRQRPHGLNTVELLKLASTELGIGPAHAMSVAERLYTQMRVVDIFAPGPVPLLRDIGYLSYPRTESSAYPKNFDFDEVLSALGSSTAVSSTPWGEYAATLLARDITRPSGGVDVGDHPPITPCRLATEDSLGGGDMWRLYDFVARHFLGSVSGDCVLRRTKATFECGGEMFFTSGASVERPGFTSVVHWRAVSSDPLPPLARGETLQVSEVELVSGMTGPPGYLTEAELIGLMEKHGIGTDASIPTHINNICERNFVTIQSGRRVVPTELGITLVRGYQLIDPELCKPQVRAYVERQLDLVAQGKADKAAAVHHCLEQFKRKFAFFTSHIARMDALFEASFSPLSSTGRILSKCGRCSRYLKLIASRPSRLYCPTCEDVYNVPQGGAIKLYKELACPLDGFQLLLFSLGGPDGKTTPFCPFCYNHPPFEDAPRVGEGKLSSGMPCTTCMHPTCRHSPARKGVTACPACDDGTLVLDPLSAPNWRLDCNLCNCMMRLPADLHSAKVLQQECGECSSTLMHLDWKKSATSALPEGIVLQDGGTVWEGCIVCDEALSSLCQAKHGKAFVKRGGRGGRGRGRGRRGRGRGKREDPLLSFHRF